MTDRISDEVFDTVTGGDDPQRAAEAANLTRHAGSLAMTKLADGLIDPKLVLTWLLTALGAPAALTGLLVPLREAGALLPQMFIAGRVETLKHRKWAWVAGSAGQGLAALAILLAALTLEGTAAALAILAALAVLAVARSVCSVSYKDILAKTVTKTHRGTTTGLAASLSAAGVIGFALLLMTGVVGRMTLVLSALTLAVGLWLLAAVIFSSLREDASQGRDMPPLRDRLQSYRDLLAGDRDLRRFIAVRGLLTGAALAPPYMVMLGSDGDALANLGALLLASAVASLLSSYIWGRVSDRSSRRVLAASGVIAAGAMAGAAALGWAGLAGSMLALPGALFVLMIAYHGVRQGRSTHLVDMAPEGHRADYAALSNTAIGLLLLATGAIGSLSALIGAAATLIVFALLCLAGSALALTLPEVQSES